MDFTFLLGILTGYLNAMVELGILRERVIKPARIFSFAANSKHDIYSIVGSSMKRQVGSSSMPSKRNPIVSENMFFTSSLPYR